jgi:DnaK suppressor protein
MATGKMNKRQARLRDILLEKKRAMWNELRDELFQVMGEELHSQFEISLDPAEMGLVDLLADTGLKVADIRRQELTAMDEAMGRLEQGAYGICEACGREIPEERLRVMPTARYCREDQEKQEGPSFLPAAKF